MKTFLEKVVKEILASNKNLGESIIVLPSRRACVFFKKEILQACTTASFLPKIISIENYIQEIAEINLIDNTQLLFEFYSIYLKIPSKKQTETIDLFMQWANIALHDFNELDSNLVNTSSFFSTLKDIKQLNKWFKDKKPSQFAVNYLQFFENLNLLYTLLYENLIAKKIGYQGLIYREAIKNLENYKTKTVNNHIYFIGFSALNKAEEYLFQNLLNTNLTTIYWDASEDILDSNNEAGSFLRSYKNNWEYYKTHPFLWEKTNFKTDKKIEIIGTPKNVTQIKCVGELLSNNSDFNKTAIVLADENLLSLVLNSLPNNVTRLNITMGYSLIDTPLSNLFQSIFKLYLNQIKFNKVTNKHFYYKDILNFLNHPLLNKLSGNILQKGIKVLKEENNLFFGVCDLEKLLTKNEVQEISWILNLLKFSANSSVIISQFIMFITTLKNYANGVEKEYVFRFYNLFKQLETLNNQYGYITDIKTLAVFFEQLIKHEKISFQGEPLEGLQLMGMLETRALDFETLIITSLNEGVLPAHKNELSFIPFDVKNHFNLPTYKEKDALFSYHFQRLLQRASHCYLLYNTETNGYGAGEKSRFLTQLEIKNSDLCKTVINPKVVSFKPKPFKIEKTKTVLLQLKEVFERGISPSALANYIYNPIKFYEQKVLGIDEEKEIEETIATNTMGNAIHETLKELYTPFIGKVLTKNNIDKMLQNSEALLLDNFRKQYKNGSIKTGKNNLIVEVSKNYIKRFLKEEHKIINQENTLKIIAIEKEYQTSIQLDNISFPIKLKGVIDRIDELNGTLRIVDYKTGKIDANALKVCAFDMIKDNYAYTKALQVMLYTYLFTKKNQFDFSKPIEAGIISFKNLNNGFLKMNFSEQKGVSDNLITQTKINDFMIEIKKLLAEILDKNLPFTESKNLSF